MDKKRCELCSFWKDFDAKRETGECLRNAPLPNIPAPKDTTTAWPVTHKDQWCGQFESKE